MTPRETKLAQRSLWWLTIMLLVGKIALACYAGSELLDPWFWESLSNFSTVSAAYDSLFVWFGTVVTLTWPIGLIFAMARREAGRVLLLSIVVLDMLHLLHAEIRNGVSFWDNSRPLPELIRGRVLAPLFELQGDLLLLVALMLCLVHPTVKRWFLREGPGFPVGLETTRPGKQV